MGHRSLRALGLIAIVAAGATWAAAPARAAAPPTIAATWVSDVTATSANLHAEVNPNGLESRYRFEYLTEAAYQANLAAQPPLNGFAGAARAPAFGEPSLGEEESPQPALQRLEHLAPGTAYRYRVLATNTDGAVPGPPRTLATQSGAPQLPESCSNAQLRTENASTGLPDCRAWELVSPVDKNGGAIQGFGQNAGGGVLQAAAGGEAATYSSTSSFGAGAAGAPTASQYLSRRTVGGWSTENITPPTLSGAYGKDPDGVPFQLFSDDLGNGLLLNGGRCGEGEACPRGYSLRSSADGALTASPEAPDLRFAGASPQLAHLALSTCRKLTPEASETPGVGGACDPTEPNLYEWTGGALRLINILPGHSTGTPGAELAAQSGAVSASGERVYWVDGAGALYLYEAGHGKLVDGSGEAAFQVASGDGSLAYFLRSGHLLRYDAGTEIATDLTAGGGVEGVLGASADGSHVYYATAAGIFLWNEGASTAVATGPGAATAGNYPPATGTARVSSDGTHLAFLSKASLTGYENTDQETLEPDSEVYLYTAPAGSGSGMLICVSCNPTGERPLGPSTIPGAIANGESPLATRTYKPRSLAETGNRLFFDSSDRIIPRDSSTAQDVYEWEAPGSGGCQQPGGCVFLISSGRSGEASEFIDASTDGADAFFLSADSLVPSDPGSVDLYDAREGGGFPVSPSVTPCEGDACQALPSPPEDPAPGTLVPGQPNPPVSFPKAGCKAGSVLKHGKCVKKPRRKKKPARHGGRK